MNRMDSSELTKNIYINLKVLGRIEADQKLNTKESFMAVDDSTWYQWALRKYRGDSRENMIYKIDKLIDQTKNLIIFALTDEKPFENRSVYLNMTSERFLETTLQPILLNAIEGLTNLRNTYNNDTTISSKIEMNIMVLKRCLSDMENINVPKKEKN